MITVEFNKKLTKEEFEKILKEDGRLELAGEYLGEYLKTIIKNKETGETYFVSPYTVLNSGHLEHYNNDDFLTY